MKHAIIINFIIIAALTLVIGCGKQEAKPHTDKKVQQNPAAYSGKDIYTKYCRLCHGSDGTLGLANAADLSISVLTFDEKVQVITEGRKGMTSFKDQLTPEQILEVAKYIETLHQ